MQKIILKITTGIILLLTYNSCTQKNLDITIKQDGCAKLKLYSATYNTIADPSCTGSPLTASYDITFNYNGDAKCLYSIKLSPQFLTSGNGSLSATYSSSIITENNPLVTIDENAKTCTFRFDFTFANSTDANNYNHCYLVFHTENTEGESSKDAKVRLMGNCSTISAGGYNSTPVSTINVSSSTITLRLWDDGTEDGDIVSVYLNGNAVILNHSLTNAGTDFVVGPVNNGNNDLVLVAMNQGSVGPNTCAASVNGGNTVNLSLDLKTGQMVRLIR